MSAAVRLYKKLPPGERITFIRGAKGTKPACGAAAETLPAETPEERYVAGRLELRKSWRTVPVSHSADESGRRAKPQL